MGMYITKDDMLGQGKKLIDFILLHCQVASFSEEEIPNLCQFKRGDLFINTTRHQIGYFDGKLIRYIITDEQIAHGPQGNQGDRGYQGVHGIDGVQGDKGYQGERGFQGSQGERGWGFPI